MANSIKYTVHDRWNPKTLSTYQALVVFLCDWGKTRPRDVLHSTFRCLSVSGPHLKHADGGPHTGQKGRTRGSFHTAIWPAQTGKHKRLLQKQHWGRGVSREGRGMERFLATAQRTNALIQNAWVMKSFSGVPKRQIRLLTRFDVCRGEFPSAYVSEIWFSNKTQLSRCLYTRKSDWLEGVELKTWVFLMVTAHSQVQQEKSNYKWIEMKAFLDDLCLAVYMCIYCRSSHLLWYRRNKTNVNNLMA